MNWKSEMVWAALFAITAFFLGFRADGDGFLITASLVMACTAGMRFAGACFQRTRYKAFVAVIGAASNMLAQKGPPLVDHHGHVYNHSVSAEGYGICECGVRENTPESTKPCSLWRDV